MLGDNNVTVIVGEAALDTDQDADQKSTPNEQEVVGWIEFAKRHGKIELVLLRNYWYWIPAVLVFQYAHSVMTNVVYHSTHTRSD